MSMVQCSMGWSMTCRRAGFHYNLGTSRGPDKIGSRAAQNRVAGTRPAGRVLHVVDVWLAGT